MAEFTRQRGKRQEDGGLGSVLDLLLANARLVLGVSGAAVLAIATLAVKRVRLARPLSGLGGRERTAIPWRRAAWLPRPRRGKMCRKPSLAAAAELVPRVWQKCRRCRWQRRGHGAACSHPAGARAVSYPVCPEQHTFTIQRPIQKGTLGLIHIWMPDCFPLKICRKKMCTFVPP